MRRPPHLIVFFRPFAFAALAATVATPAVSPAFGQPVATRVTRPADRELIERIVAASDARARRPEDLDLLKRVARSGSGVAQRLAVEGLGRLERGDVVRDIAAAMETGDVDTRIAAATALGQAGRGAGSDLARAQVSARLLFEPDVRVREALAESLGRIVYQGPEHVRVAAQLMLPLLSRENPEGAIRGAVRGLYFLARQRPGRGAIPGDVLDSLAAVALTYRATMFGGGEDTRFVAAAALFAGGGATPENVTAVFADPDPFVRDRAVVALQTLNDAATVRSVVTRAMNDTAAVVRFHAVTMFSRRMRATDGCDPLLALTRDRDTTVMLIAVDSLAGCGADAEAVRLLDSLAGQPVSGNGVAWHVPTHALVALAVVDRARATGRLGRFVASDNPFVRSYAATVARRLRDTAALYRLAVDPSPIARAAGVTGLSALVAHAADSIYRRALDADDSEVWISASAALRGTTEHERTAAVLVSTLERATRRKEETTRDGRVALIERLRELGTAADTGRLRPLVSDFDPTVAAAAAGAMSAWTGAAVIPTPQGLPEVPPPTFDELARLERTLVLLETDRGTLTVSLRPFEAPTNAARFARLARMGRFDGLTLHRVVPYFVIQGGSPNANERSAPDGPFTRDEVGLPNVLGSVGLSTRGRDTGDGQFYFNTLNNPSLDHEYTVFGMLEGSPLVLHAIQEGTVIRRVRVVERP